MTPLEKFIADSQAVCEQTTDGPLAFASYGKATAGIGRAGITGGGAFFLVRSKRGGALDEHDARDLRRLVFAYNALPTALQHLRELVEENTRLRNRTQKLDAHERKEAASAKLFGKDVADQLREANERIKAIESAILGKDKKIAEFVAARERPTPSGEIITPDRMGYIREFIERFPSMVAGAELLSEVDRLTRRVAELEQRIAEMQEDARNPPVLRTRGVDEELERKIAANQMLND